MALSTCPKCDGRLFEMKQVSPSGSNYKQNFVQCSSCGTPVGVVDYYDAGVLLKAQADEIETIQKHLKQLMSAIHTVNENLALLERLIKR